MYKSAKYALCVLTFCTIDMLAKTNSADRPLKNPIIPQVDGIPGGIEGEKNIPMMVHIIQEVGYMLRGKKSDGQLVGRFMFRGKNYSIRALRRLESSDKLKKDPALKQELQILLTEVVEMFLETVKPFINQALGAKQATVILMEEWAELRKRTDSFMLSWNHQPEGKEFEIFRQEITNFAALEQFCQDLLSFLEDLLNSCPRGWHQYEQQLAKYKKS